MHKDVKDALKGLKIYADPPSSYKIAQNRHLRVSWEMVNDDGQRVKVQETISVTPSDENWIHSHRRRLGRKFKELNISKEVTHI